MRVVTNTSPLVYLFRLGLLDLLHQLYGQVVVPQSVVDELSVGRSEGFDVPDCSIHEWMVVETIAIPPLLRLVTALGRGEAEALALALSRPTDLVLLDDGAARQLASMQSLRFTGTLGMLVQAKRQGLVSEVMPLVQQLQGAGFRMTTALISMIARQAGE